MEIRSWDLGARSQALLELSAPQYSVNTLNASLPPSANIPLNLSSTLDIVLRIAKNCRKQSHSIQYKWRQLQLYGPSTPHE